MHQPIWGGYSPTLNNFNSGQFFKNKTNKLSSNCNDDIGVCWKNIDELTQTVKDGVTYETNTGFYNSSNNNITVEALYNTGLIQRDSDAPNAGYNPLSITKVGINNGIIKDFSSIGQSNTIAVSNAEGEEAQFINNGIIEKQANVSVNNTTAVPKYNTISANINEGNKITINNNGVISTNINAPIGGPYVGNGVFFFGTGNGSVTNTKPRYLNNTGFITASTTLADQAQNYGSGNGVIFNSTTTEGINAIQNRFVTNSGKIQAYGTTGVYEGFGPFASSYLNALLTQQAQVNNSGILQGEVDGNFYTKPYNSSGTSPAPNRSGLIGNGLAIGNLIGSLRFTGSDINNSGVIHGYNNNTNTFEEDGVRAVISSGNGIGVFNVETTTNNIGVVKGSKFALQTSALTATGKPLLPTWRKATVVNYGLMAGGKGIFSHKGSAEETADTNYGMYAQVDIDFTNNTASAREITLGDAAAYSALKDDKKLKGQSGDIIESIVNANSFAVDNGMDSYVVLMGDKSYDNTIINGAGMTSGTLSASQDSNLILNNSIINSYSSALTVGKNATVTATDTIFNGGGVLNKDYVIIANGNQATITIDGKSQINGNTLFSGNEGDLNIGNQVSINGDLVSTGSNNVLVLGDNTTDFSGNSSYEANASTTNGENLGYIMANNTLKLFYDIDGFDNIAINGRVTAYETAKIKTGDIVIDDKSQLVVRLDGTQTKDEKVIGHALYEHQGSLSAQLPDSGDSYTPQLIFANNGLGIGTVIAMDGTTLGQDNNPESPHNPVPSDDNDGKLNDFQIDTWSLLNTAVKQTQTGVIKNGEYIKGNGDYTGDIIIVGKSFKDIFYKGETPELSWCEMFPDHPRCNPVPPSFCELNPEDPSCKDPEPSWCEMFPDHPRCNPVPPSFCDLNPEDPSCKPIVPPIEPEEKSCEKSDEPYCSIHESIINSGQDGNLYLPQDEEGVESEYLTLLDQIYANNPYMQATNLSYKNIGLFRNEVFNTKTPDHFEWIVEGRALYSYDQEKVRRNESVRTAHIDNKYSTKSTTYGALGTAEYGILDDASLGFALGMSHQKANMSYGNKLKGEAVYFGGYGKKVIGNFTFLAGLGYQYGAYDGTRVISNKYQSIENKGKVKTNSFDIYTEAKYSHKIAEETKVEPKIRVSQTFIQQNSVSEKNGVLAIDMDNKFYSIPALSVGADLVQTMQLENGILNIKGGINIEQPFGKKNNYNTARIKKSTDFKVKGPKYNTTIYKLGASAEFEQNKKFYYNLGADYNFAKDRKKDVNAKLGIGYRFN